jgi:hypothetical protein
VEILDFLSQALLCVETGPFEELLGDIKHLSLSFISWDEAVWKRERISVQNTLGWVVVKPSVSLLAVAMRQNLWCLL